MAGALTILVADDHPVLRTGLRQVIEQDPSLRVVAEAGDGDEAIERMSAFNPDVAVIDLDMPKLDGFGVLRVMNARGLRTAAIILTLHADERLLLEALDLGARGYLLKDSAVTALVDGIKTVAAGQHYVTASLTPLLVDHRARARALVAQQPTLSQLTPAELRIVRLIADGRSSKDIADLLGVHYRTIENHRVSVAQKLGLRGHNAVLKWALAHRHQL